MKELVSSDPNTKNAGFNPSQVKVFLLAAENSSKACVIDLLDTARYQVQQLSCIDDIVEQNSGVDEDSSIVQADIVLLCADLITSAPSEYISLLLTLLGDRYAPVILIADANNNDVLIEAMAAGAHDYISLPIAASLLEAKIKAQMRISEMQQVVHKQNRQIVEHHDHLMLEQQLAKEVFNKVAQDSNMAMENIRHWLSPIAVFNGDVLLAAPTPNGGLMVLLGDFTGHGLAAAIGAIPLASTFYSMVEKGFTMQDIIKELNSKLYGILPVSVFCCASMAQFNFEQGVVDIWNAGLPDCYILRQDSSEVEVVSSNALALGIVGGGSYDARPTRFNMASGDRLYFLSDGVLEATASSGEQFGDDRLMSTIASQAQVDAAQGFDAIKQQVVDFIGSQSRADDISLVEISMVDQADFAAMYEASEGHSSEDPVSWVFNYQVRPDSLRHQDPVPLLLHTLMEVPNLRRYSGQLFTIISELYNNAVDHGLLGLASSLKQEPEGFARFYNERLLRLQQLASGSVSFSLDYQGDASQGALLLEVVDSGSGFDFAQLIDDGSAESVDSDSKRQSFHGRGIPLLQSICSKVEYLGCGNHARVEFRWNS